LLALGVLGAAMLLDVFADVLLHGLGEGDAPLLLQPSLAGFLRRVDALLCRLCPFPRLGPRLGQRDAAPLGRVFL
jgi:hypothetical protein